MHIQNRGLLFLASLMILSCSHLQAYSQGETLTLEMLEQRAIRNNPTLSQADAVIQAAEGRRKQAGLWPNPIVGYDGDGLAFNSLVAPYRNGQYFYFEQSILTGGKLSKSKKIALQERTQAEANAVSQRMRVLNSVRMLYYELLGAQQLMDLRKRLADLTREAAGISEGLYNVGQADRPDVLASEVEAQRAEIDQLRAENELNRVWQRMAALVNDPALRPARLAGSIEAEAPKLEHDEVLATILRESPEMKAALAGVERAKAAIRRARAEPMPDVFFRTTIGYSNEFSEFFGGKTGWESRVEAGVRIPIFNRNQGNVAATSAELMAAEREVTRVELDLRSRFADAYNHYLTSLAITNRYQREVLPRSQRAYDLYLARFRQMAAAYPQVLISQRTLFQLQTEYVSSLVDLWRNIVQLRGLLLTGGLEAPPASIFTATGVSQ